MNRSSLPGGSTPPDDRPIGVDELASEMSRAMSQRAARVAVEATPAARQAVDRRLQHRQRRRRIRRGTLALGASAVLLVAVVVSLDRASPPEVETRQSADSSVDPSHSTLEPGMESQDPADLGLPRVILEPTLGMRPTTSSPARSRMEGDVVTASYSSILTDQASPGRQVVLTVLHEPARLRRERFDTILEDALSSEAIPVLGESGLAVQHRSGDWTVVVAPDPSEPDIGVGLIASGVTRQELDEVVGSLRIVDADEWRGWREACCQPRNVAG